MPPRRRNGCGHSGATCALSMWRRWACRRRGDAVDWLEANPHATGQDILGLPCSEPPHEDTTNPLDGIDEKVAAEPGAAFKPEVLNALAALKQADRSAYESLRAKLKRGGCRVTALDEALPAASGENGRRPSQADILLGLTLEGAELFHTREGVGYADIQIMGHRETWAIRSKGFKRWLARRFFEETSGARGRRARPAGP